MKETYTFSRALHMMRYSGKKMRSIYWKSKCVLEVDTYGVLRRNCGSYTDLGNLSAKEIMGSWVEVDDE